MFVTVYITRFHKISCFSKSLLCAFFVCVLVFLAGPVFSQFKQVHLESNENNHIQRINLYSDAEGYIAFSKTLGFTVDSGKTIVYKPITNSNVNYNGYNVNLTFGFELSGVKAFDRNKLLVYGHYGLVPSILYSGDGGNNFKLVFHSQYSQFPNSYVRDMVFPGNGAIGFAVDKNRVLKTTDGGLTWLVNFNADGSYFTNIQAINTEIVETFNTEWSAFNARYTTTNGGATWVPTFSNTGINYLYFVNAGVAWLNTKDGKIMTTANGGNSWTEQNDAIIAPVNFSKLVVVNDSTAYGTATDGFDVYKTTNTGKIWERLYRDNNYSSPGYSLNDIQINGSTILAGGGHGYLALSDNGGGTVVPRAYFTIDESAAETTGNIKLTNYSKSGNTYKWLLNGKVIATTYNASYTAELYGPNDTLRLIVTNKLHADTLTKVTTFSQAVQITGIYPISAATGQTISISGKHFRDVKSVTFGGIPAQSFQVNRYSDNINAVVGKGASGDVKVTTAKAVSAFAGFTYIPPPEIISFSPASAAKDDTITVNGKNFNTLSSVFFNKTEAKFRIVSAAEVRVAVPAGNTTGNIIFNSYTGADTSGIFKLQPVIKPLNVSSGSYNSTITVYGDGFFDVKSIMLDGNPVLNFNVYNDRYYGDNITITLGEGGTEGKLVITTGNGLSAEYTGFKYYFSPAITSFTPAFGTPGTQVTISGTNFSTTSTGNFVYFGAVRAVVNSATATSLVVSIPMGATYSPITIATSYATSTSVKYFTPIFSGGAALSAGSFGAHTNNWAGNNARSLSILDFNSDGKPDVSVTAFDDAGNINYFVENNSTPGNISVMRTQSVTLSDNSGGTWIYSAVNDWDLDGDLDVILVGLNNRKATYVKSIYSPTGSYAYSNQVVRVSNYNADLYSDPRYLPTGIGIADMDGDGQTDFLVSGNFPDHPTFPNIAVSDIDGDGKADVLAHFNDTLAVYRNISTKNNIAYAPRVNFLAGATISRIVAGDFDNDGKTDIAMIVKSTPGVMVWKNNSIFGSIALTKAATMATTAEPSSIAIADLNGDGKVDIGVGHNNGVLLYQNTSGVSIGFGAPVTINLNATMDLAFADLDGDAKPDIIGLNGLGIEPGINIMRNLAGGPQITSFSPEGGPAGTSIEIIGTGFTGTTSVTVGGVTVRSFKVNSETSITAIAGDGAKGFIALDSPPGSGTSLSVFHFLPQPVIYVNGYVTQAAAINLGESVPLDITPYDNQFKVQWYKNGVAIPGGTISRLLVTESGSYACSMAYGSAAAQTSKPVQVRVVLVLPADNIKIAATNITCKGSKNGSISIHANLPASYTVTLSGSDSRTAKFSSDAKIENLSPGNYSVCVTIDNYPEYQQCFNLLVTEPKDLSVYTVVNKAAGTINLALEGADFYNITVNNKLYTASGSITLPLNNGFNKISVSTDKLCQGVVEKVIDLSDNIIPYPNPVRDVLSINLGNNVVASAFITITSVNGGRVLYSREVANPYDVLQVDMTGFRYGVYLVRLKLDTKESVYKITKQ